MRRERRSLLTQANESVEYDWQTFDPYMHLQPVNFKVGPNDFKIVEWSQTSTRFLSITQLFGVMIDLRNLITSSPNHIEVSKAEMEDYGPDELDDNDMVTNILPHHLGSRNDEAPLSPIKTGRNEFFGDGQEQEQLHDLSQEIQEPSETAPKLKSIDLSQESLDIIDLETLIQLLRYRIKNNSLGQIHYLPSEWNGKLETEFRFQVQEAEPHFLTSLPG